MAEYESGWLAYWLIYIWISIAVSAVTVVWFTIGGLRDLRQMLRRLETAQRDEMDDGTVSEERD